MNEDLRSGMLLPCGTDEVKEGGEHGCDVNVDPIVHGDEERVEVLLQERDLCPIVLAQAADDVGDPGLFERRDLLSIRSRAVILPFLHYFMDADLGSPKRLA